MPGPKNHLGKHIMGAMMTHDKDVHDLLVKTLEDHDSQTAQKIALTLAEFHRMFVAPMQKRLWFMEQPWYRRIWIKFKYRRFLRQQAKTPKTPNVPETPDLPTSEEPAAVTADTFRVHQPTEFAPLVDQAGHEFSINEKSRIVHVGN